MPKKEVTSAMKKGFSALLILILTFSLLISCAPAVTIDINALADDLVANAAFADEPVKRRDDTISDRYDCTGYVAAVAYATGGATAEEIAFFEAEDDKAAAAIYEAMEYHLSSQRRSYESYNPEGVVNLNGAILEQHGRYVLFCVCADADSAADIIASYTAPAQE
ncbi:MAG: DUF4358 domain-containing protein [Ruminococcaceae bacterium]|nr:DUF4358 domain-containing protein [Oscillospiraceae bacterium]